MSSATDSSPSRPARWLTAAAFVLPAAAWNAIRMLPRIWVQKLPFKASLWNGLVRSLMEHMPPQHIQAVFPSTLETYKAWIRRVGSARGFQERIQVTDAKRANMLWLEKVPKYDKIILFFHGGGYALPLSDGHLDWMAHMQELLASQDVQVGVAVLEHDLVPGHPYPAQLSQAIDAFQTLLNAGFDMENVVIGGDSAGGHLALSLLSHLRHPRTLDWLPSSTLKDDCMGLTPEILAAENPGRLPAVFLVSPLCSLDTTLPCYTTRCSADMLSRTIVRVYGGYLLNGSIAQGEQEAGLGWSMPLDMNKKAVTAWWEDLDTVVTNVLITVGQEEAFRDHCIEFAEVLKDVERKGAGFKTTLLLQQSEAHDACLLDFAAGRPPSATTRAIDQFVLDAFNSRKT